MTIRFRLQSNYVFSVAVYSIALYMKYGAFIEFSGFRHRQEIWSLDVNGQS
jgi:hypothetical protein